MKYRNVLQPEQKYILALVRGESPPPPSSWYNCLHKTRSGIGESVVMHSDSEVTYHTRKSRNRRIPPHDGATSLDDHSRGKNEDDTRALISSNGL